MQKHYDHTKEQEIYELWEKSGGFNPDTRLVSESVGRLDSSAQTKKTDQPTTDNRQPFSIIMPPPNANDPLHIGHAMFIALEDILIRYHRMKGDDTVWIPGTDHAGIETQFVFEKKLAKQGKSRFNYDRETLFNMIWEYVQENSGVAVDQMKKLGASADWSRYHFTLDPEVVSFVNQTFEKLHSDDLVYRDVKLVNFCTKCGTSYSELEVNHVEQTSPLYYVKYQFVDDHSSFITVATTRPEPIFVDTHLAVHPDNPKTQHLIGKKVLNPLTDEKMEIIVDEFVDPEFGTGIVKLTPAHDFADFDVAKKHNLPIIEALTMQGKIVATAPEELAGLNIQQARAKSVEMLKAKGLIEKIDDKYQNRVGTCYRCSRVLEPLPLPQFFIKVKPLADKALQALDNKETIIHGAGRDKILRHWLENLRDWNISRQIVWGIRMPVWYSIEDNPDISVRFIDKEGETQSGKVAELLQTFDFAEIEKGLQQLHAPADATYVISTSQPTNQSTSQPMNYLQETDTFDTWFSSGQWPVVTLQTQGKQENGKTGKQGKGDSSARLVITDEQRDPSSGIPDIRMTGKTQNTKHQSQTEQLTTDQLTNRPTDYDRFYPTSVMETGYDILPFWVMRMMLLGIYLTGKSPFKDVYLHGLVRDEKGQKMSKSKGNVINPIDLTEKYGSDALRMALVMSTTPGSDTAVGESKIKGMRNFSNKIWNAARFIIMMEENDENVSQPNDKEFLTKINEIQKTVSGHLDALRIGLAAEVAYNEFWHWFCDVCIEDAKNGKLSQHAITQGLIQFILILHPFMPSVTESVWRELQDKSLVDKSSLLMNNLYHK